MKSKWLYNDIVYNNIEEIDEALLKSNNIQKVASIIDEYKTSLSE